MAKKSRLLAAGLPPIAQRKSVPTSVHPFGLAQEHEGLAMSSHDRLDRHGRYVSVTQNLLPELLQAVVKMQCLACRIVRRPFMRVVFRVETLPKDVEAV